MTSLYHIKKISKIPAIEKKLLLKGFLVHFCSFFFTRFVPVRYYQSFFYINNIQQENTNSDLEAKKLLLKTILRLRKYSPFNISCLEISMITLSLSKMLGIYCRMKLALNTNNKNKIFAHSYVTFGNGQNLNKCDTYKDIICFN